MRLSENIRAFRKERALTQEQLAQALGVTAGAVYKWEAGLSTPDISLILELADFFDTSVDVLLGYEVRDNKREAAAERLRDFLYRRDERGLAEADKLLTRYPNCFEIVYRSADLHWVFGFMHHDQALLRRSIELMERARLLLSQNTDPEIGEATINYSIAKAYSAMGEQEKATALFKRSNPHGVHDDYIGYILGTACDSPDEAACYLSRALLHCASSLVRVAIGYFHVYWREQDFSSAAGFLQLSLDFFSALKKPGGTSYLDKACVQLYVYLAQAQIGLGRMDGARNALRRGRDLARQFDLSPDYHGNGLRFVSAGRRVTAFDDMGDTAMECMLDLLEARQDETLTALWREITEEARDGQE